MMSLSGKLQCQSSFLNTYELVMEDVWEKVYKKTSRAKPDETKMRDRPYQVIVRENSPCLSLTDVVDATQTKKIKSCCYLPGMPEWFIKYLRGTEGAKQKKRDGIKSSQQGGTCEREKRVRNIDEFLN